MDVAEIPFLGKYERSTTSKWQRVSGLRLRPTIANLVMSTREISFFALPSELRSWLEEFEQRIPLQFVLKVGSPIPGFRAVATGELVKTWEEASTAPFWRFYIAAPGGTWPVEDTDLNPNRWGLVTCDPPQVVDGDTLLMASVSSKSDYYGMPLSKGRLAHGLHAKIKKLMVKKLSRPVWARNIKYPERGAGAYHDIWYSEGVVEWVAKGNKLRQRAVANVEYLLGNPEK